MAVLFAVWSVGFAEEAERDADDGLDIGDGNAVVEPPNPALEARFAAWKEFQESKDGLEADYCKGLAKAVVLADEVRLYLLDFEPVEEVPEGDGGEYFPIKPYGMRSKVLQQKTLRAADAAACGKLVGELLSGEEE